MQALTPADARAVLRADEGLSRFHLSTAAPSPVVAPFVENYWIVSWDLRGRQPHRQAVLPYSAVNMSFKPGRSRIAGVIRGHFGEQLEGAGRVVGVRFRSGSFRPFLEAPVSTITDRLLGVADVFGPAGAALERTVLGAATRPRSSSSSPPTPGCSARATSPSGSASASAAARGCSRSTSASAPSGSSNVSACTRLPYGSPAIPAPTGRVSPATSATATSRISSAISPLRSAALRPGTPATAPSRERDRT